LPDRGAQEFSSGPLPRLSTLQVTNFNQGDEFLLYPNPATDRIYIRSAMLNNGITGYRVFDIQGGEMLSGEMEESSAQLEVSTLPVGLYLLELAGESSTFRKVFFRK